MNPNDTISAVNEVTSKGFERMASLGELNLRVLERMAAHQMDTVNLYMEHGMRLMKLATEAKGYNELVKGQVEATKELGERLVTETQTTMKLAGELRDDYRQWFEKNLGEVSEDLHKAGSLG